MYCFDSSNVASVSTVVKYDFDKLSLNRMPNGSIFSSNFIKSEEVLRAALTKVGLSDKYSAIELSKCIRISGVYPEGIIENARGINSLLDMENSSVNNLSSYVPEEYTISLVNRFKGGMSEKDMGKLLEAIVDCSKQYFEEHYILCFDGQTIWNYFDFDNADYDEQLNYLSTYLEILRAYSAQMYAEDPLFSYRDKDFSYIVDQCDLIADMNILTTKNHVTIKGYSKNSTRRALLYNYKINRLNDDISFCREEESDIDGLIELYARDSAKYIGSGDSVVVIDANSTITYQSLVNGKIAINDIVVQDTKSLSRYTDNLERLSKNMSMAEIKSITEEINAIKHSIENLSTEFEDLFKRYKHEKYDENIISFSEVKYKAVSVFSMEYIVLAVEICGLLESAVILSFCISRWIYAERKYQSKKAKKNEQKVAVYVLD